MRESFLESGKLLYEILYPPYYKLLVQSQSVAGRPTFKYRKIVIEPAVDFSLSISKVIKAAIMKMKNNPLAREEDLMHSR